MHESEQSTAWPIAVVLMIGGSVLALRSHRHAHAGAKLHAVAALHCKDAASAKTIAKLAESALA
jgi:hypothetical protein